MQYRCRNIPFLPLFAEYRIPYPKQLSTTTLPPSTTLHRLLSNDDNYQPNRYHTTHIMSSAEAQLAYNRGSPLEPVEAQEGFAKQFDLSQPDVAKDMYQR